MLERESIDSFTHLSTGLLCSFEKNNHWRQKPSLGRAVDLIRFALFLSITVHTGNIFFYSFSRFANTIL
jgi:hypothetical protein